MRSVRFDSLSILILLLCFLSVGLGCNLTKIADLENMAYVDDDLPTRLKAESALSVPSITVLEPLELESSEIFSPSSLDQAVTPPIAGTPELGQPAVPAAATDVPTVIPTVAARAVTRTIGLSASNLPIISYQFKDGPTRIVFVGGIHGGWEWNTILLAFEAIDFFSEYIDVVPDSVTLFIIPSANPDGQMYATGKEGRFEPADVISDTLESRFNGNNVDINRNWDCDWIKEAVWRDKQIEAGEMPFSEPESVALRDFIFEQDPVTVIFWHSTANAVFAAKCPEVYGPSRLLADVYGMASGYPVFDTFTAYRVTGDASDWLVTQNIPSFTVELATSNRTEWDKNRNGILAILDYFASEENRVHTTSTPITIDHK